MAFKSFKLNIIFYLSLLLNLVLLIFPIDFKMGVYGPNFLGWFWIIFLIPLSIITFLWLLLIDLKNKKTRQLLKRTIILFISISFFIIYWIYKM